MLNRILIFHRCFFIILHSLVLMRLGLSIQSLSKNNLLPVSKNWNNPASILLLLRVIPYITFITTCSKRCVSPLSASLKKKEITMEKTELKCPECGKDLIIRMGRYGKFYACTGFPSCKYTATIEGKDSKEPQADLGLCHKCNTGKILRRRTKKGRTFYVGFFHS